MGDPVTNKNLLVIPVFVTLVLVLRSHIKAGGFQIILGKADFRNGTAQLFQMLRCLIHGLVIVRTDGFQRRRHNRLIWLQAQLSDTFDRDGSIHDVSSCMIGISARMLYAICQRMTLSIKAW